MLAGERTGLVDYLIGYSAAGVENQAQVEDGSDPETVAELQENPKEAAEPVDEG